MHKDKPFTISLTKEQLEILEQLSLNEKKSVEKIVQEIIEKSLMY